MRKSLRTIQSLRQKLTKSTEPREAVKESDTNAITQPSLEQETAEVDKQLICVHTRLKGSNVKAPIGYPPRSRGGGLRMRSRIHQSAARTVVVRRTVQSAEGEGDIVGGIVFVSVGKTTKQGGSG